MWSHMAHNAQLPPLAIPEGKLLAVFPISHFVIFPRALVPLHIFEARYQQMLKDINETQDKNLVVTTFNSSNQPIEIGVLVKIISQKELKDGRSNIVVSGQYRVRIVDYFRPYSYNDYAIGEIQPLPELEKSINMTLWQDDIFPSLLDAFKNRFDADTRRRITKIAEMESARMSVEEIVNTMCQFSPLSIEDKLDLLHSNSILERATQLENYLLRD